MQTKRSLLHEIVLRQISQGQILDKLIINVEKIMTALTDLQNAVADIQAQDTAVQAAVATAVDLIKMLHTGAGTVSDADVEAAVTALQAASSDFSTAVSNLGSATPLP